MKPIGVLVLALVAFISFTDVICNPADGGTKDECQDYPGNACPLNYLPVCGSDGITYGNECMFCGAKRSKGDLAIVSKGRCPVECQNYGEACTKEYRPLCGSDQNTYNNECLLCNAKKTNADLELAAEGPCSCSLLTPVHVRNCPEQHRFGVSREHCGQNKKKFKKKRISSSTYSCQKVLEGNPELRLVANGACPEE